MRESRKTIHERKRQEKKGHRPDAESFIKWYDLIVAVTASFNRNRLVDYLANSNTGGEKEEKGKEAKPVDDGPSSVCMGFMPYSKQARIIKHVIQLASAHVRDSGYV